ncbi:MAG: hypothetical protein QXD13_01885, partial [Candidatus Pacearchaeota archaeon]
MAENGKKQENGNGEFDNLGYVKKLGYYYLGNVSRTFALTIPILRLFKGEYEYDKSELTMLFYLIPRGMDAIEDSNLSHDKKIKYLPDFTVFLKKGDEKDAPPIAEQWHKFTNDLLSERNPKNSNELAILNPKEVDMLRDFAILWRSFYKMDPELKSIAV